VFLTSLDFLSAESQKSDSGISDIETGSPGGASAIKDAHIILKFRRKCVSYALIHLPVQCVSLQVIYMFQSAVIEELQTP